MLLLFRRDHYFQNAYNHFNVRIACVAMSVRVIPLRIVPNLIHFMPLVSLNTLWKHEKTKGFLMFSGGIERDQWHEMDWFNEFMQIN